MSCYRIYYKDGAKMMSPVLTETEYRNLRNSVKQKTVMKAVRGGDEGQKTKLLQMNYSCLPNEDGSLKGSKRMSTTVGMDINSLYHDYEFTSFAAPAGNRNKSAIQERIAVVQKESGSTLRDKFENFWIGKIGITKADVDEFRSIMLVDPIETAIKGVELQEKENLQPTIKAVYNLNGVEVPQHSLNNRGTYVVRYSNGTSRKVVVK